MDNFFKNWIGEDFLESLTKSVVYKQDTKSVLEHQELLTAMQVVPRTILQFLKMATSDMMVGGHKTVLLHFVPNSPELYIHKIGLDVYSGQIIQQGKVVAEYKFKSLPGLGIVITSTFELYDVSEKPVDKAPEIDYNQDINRKIEERLYFINLVEQIVDKKLSEREAINQMVLRRIAYFNEIPEKEEVSEEKYENGLAKLKLFLQKRIR